MLDRTKEGVAMATMMRMIEITIRRRYQRETSVTAFASRFHAGVTRDEARTCNADAIVRGLTPWSGLR
jgi:hypothetical protein